MESAKFMQTSEISENIKKEVQLSTDLLAEAGVEEPATFKLMKTKTFLIVFMIFNLMASAMVGFMVDSRTRFVYVGKAVINALGLYSIHKKSLIGFSAFGVCYGISTLLWAVPIMAGVLVLYSKDVCSILAGASPTNTADFINYCRNNLTTIRMFGTAFLASEVIIDAFVLVQVVKYQRFLRAVEGERAVLRRYHGKERIALP